MSLICLFQRLLSSFKNRVLPQGSVVTLLNNAQQEKNDLHVRFFAYYLGVPEDPATGSANGCLAAYLVKYKYFGTKKIDVRVKQGYGLGRPSILLLEADEKAGEI